jgi:hypothetical protein
MDIFKSIRNNSVGTDGCDISRELALTSIKGIHTNLLPRVALSSLLLLPTDLHSQKSEAPLSPALTAESTPCSLMLHLHRSKSA